MLITVWHLESVLFSPVIWRTIPAVKEKHKAKVKEAMKHCKSSFYSSPLTSEMFRVFSFLRNIPMCWNRDYVQEQWYDPDMQSSYVIQKHLYIQYGLHRRDLLSITFESTLFYKLNIFSTWMRIRADKWDYLKLCYNGVWLWKGTKNNTRMAFIKTAYCHPPHNQQCKCAYSVWAVYSFPTMQ